MFGKVINIISIIVLVLFVILFIMKKANRRKGR